MEHTNEAVEMDFGTDRRPHARAVCGVVLLACGKPHQPSNLCWADLRFLCAQALPVLEAFADFALEAAFGWVVEILARHVFGEIILA